MKSINLKDYKNDGVFINLDMEYIPYQKLLYEPSKYLNRYTTYYIYCNHGYKSSTVVSELSQKGYNVVQVKR